MNILFALDKYRNSQGGADKLARGVVDALVEAGHTLRVIEVGSGAEIVNGNPSIKSYPLPQSKIFRDSDLRTIKWNGAWTDIVSAEILEFKPDVVLTQNMLAPGTVSAARKAGVRTVLFFHGYRCIDPCFFENKNALESEHPGFWDMPLRLKLKWPLVYLVQALYTKTYTCADTIVANSDYICKVLKRFFGRDAEVLYPLIDVAKDIPARLPANPEGAILFIKPQRIKGVEVFLKIAKAMPEKKFIVAGSASGKMERKLAAAENIEHLGWVDDMEELYKRCALLLAPARIPEPFGRVFVEAGARGIPSVASDAGGIPEAVGIGGLVVSPDAEIFEWVGAINQALDLQKELGDNAASQARKILRKHNAARLLEIVEK